MNESAHPPARRARSPASDKEPADQYVRRLARERCRGAMQALAQVAKDTSVPPAARITAATSLVGWALGATAESAGPTVEPGGKRVGSEQVVRLAWMDSKDQRPAPAKKPKGETGKSRPGKEPTEKKAR